MSMVRIPPKGSEYIHIWHSTYRPYQLQMENTIRQSRGHFKICKGRLELCPEHRMSSWLSRRTIRSVRRPSHLPAKRTEKSKELHLILLKKSRKCLWELDIHLLVSNSYLWQRSARNVPRLPFNTSKILMRSSLSICASWRGLQVWH